ncbi:MAG: ABC transporter permease [Pseudomonadota bacterium]
MGRWLKHLFILCRKEIGDAFASPFIYVVTGIFSILMGWLFFNYLILSKNLSTLTITETVIKPIFGNMNFIFLFLAPLLTMRTFAEEKKMHTLELLFTSHLSHLQIILGKYLALLFQILFTLSFTLLFPLILQLSGYSDWGIVAANYLGLIFSIMAYLTVGLFASSLTENQIVSALASFALLFGCILLVVSIQATNNPLVGEMARYLSVPYHYEGFVRGGVRTYSLVYYLSFIGFFLYLTHKSLDSRKW